MLYREASSSYLGASLVRWAELVFLRREVGIVERKKEDSRFAVAAPWGIKLNENILVVVDDNLLEVVRHNDGHRSLLLLRNGLALHARLDLAVDEVLDESANSLLGQFLALIERIFAVLDDILDGKGRELVGLKIEVAGVLTKIFSVDCRHVDNSLVLFGDGLQRFRQTFALFGSLGEDVGQRDAGLGRNISTTKPRGCGKELLTPI